MFRARQQPQIWLTGETPSAAAGQAQGPTPAQDWANLELAHLEADAYVGGFEGLWTRGLLIGRHIADGELACFTTWCRVGTPTKTLIALEGRHWAIEDAFETAKIELGLDHDDTRSWHASHRHVSLVTLAFPILAVTRHRANVAAKDKRPLP